ncbi:MAG TPA: GAF domain-containing sensor histidine kinase [Vicinamibacterales bacterium]|nr:GAF domain-containing sensor histidine kinase [Vicinamibacterales bacterium]
MDTPERPPTPADEISAAHERLLALVAASHILGDAPDVIDVWRRTVALADQAIAADAYAVWRLEPPDRWKVVYARGVSDAFTQRVIAQDVRSERSLSLLSAPLVIEDVESSTLIAHLKEAYRAEGIRTMAIFPLVLGGRPGGTLVFYFRQRRALSSLETQTGQALATLATVAITTAELQASQRRATEQAAQAAQQAEFLSQATRLLNQSLDYQQTLSALTALAVPHIADWCAVDMLDDAGDVQRLAVGHVDPTKVELAHRLQSKYPANPDAAGGVHQVIRTGTPVFVPRIPPELLERAARDEEHLTLIRALSLTSYMSVPLVTRRGTVGAITFVSAESGREYAAHDLEFAKDVAARAGLAIENALAYREAMEANRLKDEFLATLSHEIRTPLNAMIGYTRMVRDGSVAAERRDHALDVIERNAEVLRHLVEDVLDAARMTSGRLMLASQTTSIREIVRQSIATVLPTAQAKGVRLQADADGGTDAVVMGDPDRLQQILWNLLHNAVKFTPAGGSVTARVEDDGPLVKIVVQDTGRGITPAFLPHVFERFRQEQGGPKSASGLGLGLAIVKDLCELHGGRVEAFSEGPDHGATFTVWLPVWHGDAVNSGAA